MVSEHDGVDVFIGIDVGESAHHAVAVDRTGTKLLDQPLAQDEAKRPPSACLQRTRFGP